MAFKTRMRWQWIGFALAVANWQKLTLALELKNPLALAWLSLAWLGLAVVGLAVVGLALGSSLK